MAYEDDVADAESLGDDEYYDDEYEDEEEQGEGEYLFGTIPRTPGLIAIAALGVVILILLAALVSSTFGFVDGISGMTVNIPNQEGDIDDEKLDVEVTTNTPAFGKNADGTGDLFLYYDDEIIWTGTIKIIASRGYQSIPYDEFYVDNGEYKVEVSFEGELEYDTIELYRTAHHIIVSQIDHMAGSNDDEQEEYVLYKVSLLPNEEMTGNQNLLYVPGEGYMRVYFVDNENDQNDDQQWETVMNITFTTDFDGFAYKFPDEKEENLSSDQAFLLDFKASKLTDQKGEGYYTVDVHFVNSYGLEDEGAFRDEISTLPEDNPDESFTWIYLGDE